MAARVSVPAMDPLRKSRLSVQWDDASLVIPLIFDHHVTGALDDEEVAVVSAGKDWRSAKREAALAQIQVLGDVSFYWRIGIRVVLIGSVSPGSVLDLRCFRRQGRNFAVGRIYDQRGSLVRRDTLLPGA